MAKNQINFDDIPPTADKEIIALEQAIKKYEETTIEKPPKVYNLKTIAGLPAIKEWLRFPDLSLTPEEEALLKLPPLQTSIAGRVDFNDIPLSRDPVAPVEEISPPGFGSAIAIDKQAEEIMGLASQRGIGLAEAEDLRQREESIKQGFFGKTKKAWERGGEAVDLDFLWSAVFRGEMTVEEATARTKELEDKFKADPLEARNWAENIWLKTAAMAHPMASGISKGVTYGVTAAGGAAAVGQAGPQAALPEEIVTMPTAYGVGQVYGNMSYWSEQGLGSIYREALSMGLDDKTAKAVAAIGGPVYGAIEFSQVGRLIPGFQHMKRTVVGSALRYLGTVGFEVAEEAEQKVVTEGSVLVGKLVDGMIRTSQVPKELKRIAVEAFNEAKEALGPMALLAFPGAAVETVVGKEKEAKPGEAKPGEAKAVAEKKPPTAESLTTMPWAQLQALAREHGVPAFQRRPTLELELAREMELAAMPISQRLGAMKWPELQREARKRGIHAFQQRDKLEEEILLQEGLKDISSEERYGGMGWRDLQAAARKMGVNPFQKRGKVIADMLGKEIEPAKEEKIRAGELAGEILYRGALVGEKLATQEFGISFTTDPSVVEGYGPEAAEPGEEREVKQYRLRPEAKLYVLTKEDIAGVDVDDMNAVGPLIQKFKALGYDAIDMRVFGEGPAEGEIRILNMDMVQAVEEGEATQPPTEIRAEQLQIDEEDLEIVGNTTDLIREAEERGDTETADFYRELEKYGNDMVEAQELVEKQLGITSPLMRVLMFFGFHPSVVADRAIIQRGALDHETFLLILETGGMQALNEMDADMWKEFLEGTKTGFEEGTSFEEELANEADIAVIRKLRAEAQRLLDGGEAVPSAISLRIGEEDFKAEKRQAPDVERNQILGFMQKANFTDEDVMQFQEEIAAGEERGYAEDKENYLDFISEDLKSKLLQFMTEEKLNSLIMHMGDIYGNWDEVKIELEEYRDLFVGSIVELEYGMISETGGVEGAVQIPVDMQQFIVSPTAIEQVFKDTMARAKELRDLPIDEYIALLHEHGAFASSNIEAARKGDRGYTIGLILSAEAERKGVEDAYQLLRGEFGDPLAWVEEDFKQASEELKGWRQQDVTPELEDWFEEVGDQWLDTWMDLGATGLTEMMHLDIGTVEFFTEDPHTFAGIVRKTLAALENADKSVLGSEGLVKIEEAIHLMKGIIAKYNELTGEEGGQPAVTEPKPPVKPAPAEEKPPTIPKTPAELLLDAGYWQDWAEQLRNEINRLEATGEVGLTEVIEEMRVELADALRNYYGAEEALGEDILGEDKTIEGLLEDMGEWEKLSPEEQDRISREGLKREEDLPAFGEEVPNMGGPVGQLITEVPGISKEQQETLFQALAMGIIPDTFPSYNDMVKELIKHPDVKKLEGEEATEALKGKGGSFADIADVRGSYLEKILLPQAEKGLGEGGEEGPPTYEGTVEELQEQYRMLKESIGVDDPPRTQDEADDLVQFLRAEIAAYEKDKGEDAREDVHRMKTALAALHVIRKTLPSGDGKQPPTYKGPGGRPGFLYIPQWGGKGLIQKMREVLTPEIQKQILALGPRPEETLEQFTSRVATMGPSMGETYLTKQLKKGAPGISIEEHQDFEAGLVTMIVYRDRDGKVQGVLSFVEDRLVEDGKVVEQVIHDFNFWVSQGYRGKGVALAMGIHALDQGIPILADSATYGDLHETEDLTEDSAAFLYHLSKLAEKISRPRPGQRDAGFLGLPRFRRKKPTPPTPDDWKTIIKMEGEAQKQSKQAITGKKFTATLFRGYDPKEGSYDFGMFGKGTYFSDVFDIASYFGEVRVFNVTLSNPFVISPTEDMGEVAEGLGLTVDPSIKRPKAIRLTPEQESFSAEFTAKLKELGHDGIILQGKEGKDTTTIVFDSSGYTQIAGSKVQQQWTPKPPTPAEPQPPAGTGIYAPPSQEELNKTNDELLAKLSEVKHVRKDEEIPAIKRMRRQQIARSLGIQEAAEAEKAPAADVIRRSKGGYKVTADVLQYTPIKLTKKQWDAYSRQVYNVYVGAEYKFQQTAAQDALDKLKVGRIITDAEAALLIPVMGREAAEEIAAIMEKLGDKYQRFWNLGRDLVLFWKMPFNFDVQFVRNAVNFVARHPVKYGKGTYEALRSFASGDYTNTLIKSTRGDPAFAEAEAYGMPFLELGQLAPLGKVPEQFRGRLPYRMKRVGKKRGPTLKFATKGIRFIGRWQLAAERSFVASANWFMLDLWKSRQKQWNASYALLESEGLSSDERNRILEKIDKEKRNYADVVGNYIKIIQAKSSTGRAIQAAANFVLWSPSMTWSRFRRPEMMMLKSGSRAYAMSIEATSIAKIYAVAMLLTTVANYFRDDDDQIEVEMDPTSSNWGRFKEGDTWFDFGGGEIQHYRTMAQFIVGSIKTQSGRRVEVPRAELAKNYVEGRETALIGVFHELLTGESIFGQKVWAAPDLEELEKEGTVPADVYAEAWRLSGQIPGGQGTFLTGQWLVEHLMPAALVSFAEASITDGWPQAVAAGLTEAMAMSAQSYKQRASAELAILQEELAQAYYKTKWDELTQDEQNDIRTYEPQLHDVQISIRKERKKWAEPDFDRDEALKIADQLFGSLSEAVKEELDKFGLTAGTVGRRFGPTDKPFYLNEPRFEEYLSITKNRVQSALDLLIGSSKYKGMDKQKQEDIIQSTISKAKLLAREELTKRINRGEI